MEMFTALETTMPDLDIPTSNMFSPLTEGNNDDRVSYGNSEHDYVDEDIDSAAAEKPAANNRTRIPRVQSTWPARSTTRSRTTMIHRQAKSKSSSDTERQAHNGANFDTTDSLQKLLYSDVVKAKDKGEHPAEQATRTGPEMAGTNKSGGSGDPAGPTAKVEEENRKRAPEIPQRNWIDMGAASFSQTRVIQSTSRPASTGVAREAGTISSPLATYRTTTIPTYTFDMVQTRFSPPRTILTKDVLATPPRPTRTRLIVLKTRSQCLLTTAPSLRMR